VDVSFENVSKSFGTIPALRDVTLRVKSGERFALVGPSGSGKTTLLRLVTGLDAPTTGTVAVASANGAGPADSVAMVFQTLALFPHLIARENIALGLKVRSVPQDEIERRTRAIAQLLAIQPVLDRKPHQLSAGERQRVALARALVKQPSILLLDEPFANLDSHLRAELRAELRAIHAERRMTLICVTHDWREAMILGERIGVLNSGRLEQCDTADRLLAHPASPFVKQFIAEPNLTNHRAFASGML
jgi:ABC-type sugar transport system ATPase subunit